MELREYFKIISRRWIIFGVTFVVIVLGTFIYLKTQPKTYLASTTLTVNKATVVKQSQVNYYLYDNYYNVQSSQLFSQIVTSWFSSPSVVTEIYNKAGIAVPNISQDKLAKTFKALRRDPAIINVTLTSTNRDEAQKLIDSAPSVMQDKANELARTDVENVYDIVKFNSVVTDNLPNIALDLIIAAIIGLLLGSILSMSVEYFRQK